MKKHRPIVLAFAAVSVVALVAGRTAQADEQTSKAPAQDQAAIQCTWYDSVPAYGYYNCLDAKRIKEVLDGVPVDPPGEDCHYAGENYFYYRYCQ